MELHAHSKRDGQVFCGFPAFEVRFWVMKTTLLPTSDKRAAPEGGNIINTS